MDLSTAKLQHLANCSHHFSRCPERLGAEIKYDEGSQRFIYMCYIRNNLLLFSEIFPEKWSSVCGSDFTGDSSFAWRILHVQLDIKNINKLLVTSSGL